MYALKDLTGKREERTMPRTVHIGDEWDAIEADEQFTEEEVRRAALNLLVGPSEMIDDATVIVSAEWERKEERIRGPIDHATGYRYFPEGDDLIVSIELRLSQWQRQTEPGEELQSAVRKIIQKRAEARIEEQIAEAEAQERAAQVSLAEKRARLEELRAKA